MRRFFHALVIFFLFAGSAAASKVYIDLNAPAIRKLPIAVQAFRYTGPSPSTVKDAERLRKIRAELLDTLKYDLDFSGLFRVLDNESFLEKPEMAAFEPGEIDFQEWRMIGADALIEGRFTVEGDRLRVEARLYDTVREKVIVGRRYVGSTRRPRKLAHYFSDRLYNELTGRRGIFTTRLLFVSARTGSKEVYLSDYDGRNVVRLTRNRSINLFPSWGPHGKRILYTSYKRGYPFLYMLDLVTGRETLLSGKKGINTGGRFSPDGRKVAFTMSMSTSPELFLLDLETGRTRRLTRNHYIDVSPSWSPDGKKIVFVSDRSGNPHIFVLDLPTGKTRRLTYSGKYNAGPSWSPDGKRIVYARSDGGPFNIWVMDAGGQTAVQLTYEGDNTSPSWSPDGRFIVFSRKTGGTSSIYIMQSDGTGLRRINTGARVETDPSWSPFLH